MWTTEVIAGWLDDPRIVFVLNISGGKDSTATALWFREQEIPHRRVFADTGWEAPETYEYIEYLRTILGPIDVCGVPGGMAKRVRDGARFPARLQRWCTRELKIEPLRAFYDVIEGHGFETVCVTGVRAEESEERAMMHIVEREPVWDGWMWRPLRDWALADVVDVHQRHGVRLNPLYHRGHDRVGCYPCVMSNKNDIRLVAEYAPDRIALIRELEAEATAERARRNGEEPGRYKWPDATFFQTLIGDRSKFRGSQGIDEIVAWSRTERGGRQLPLLPLDPEGGCFRWGLCDPARGTRQ